MLQQGLFKRQREKTKQNPEREPSVCSAAGEEFSMKHFIHNTELSECWDPSE